MINNFVQIVNISEILDMKYKDFIKSISKLKIKIIMFSGSRTDKLKDKEIVEKRIKNKIKQIVLQYDKENTIFISGGAKTGADEILRIVCKEFGYYFTNKYYKPDFSSGYAVWKYFKRNHKMVDDSNEIYTIWNGKSKGTLDVINYTKKQIKKGIKKTLHIILFKELLKKY